MHEVEYLLLCVGTALAAFYAHDKLEGPVAEEALWWGDTLGIGAFSVVGAQAAASVGMGPLVVPICGMFTATCGGLVRDVLCRRPPKLLYSAAQDSPAAAGTLYAPAALSGASAYALLHFVGAGAPLAHDVLVERARGSGHLPMARGAPQTWVARRRAARWRTFIAV